MPRKVYMIDPGKIVKIVNSKNPEKRQVTQKDLAGYLGISPQQLTNMKKNQAPQIVEVMFKMKEYAGCELEDFVTETEIDD